MPEKGRIERALELSLLGMTVAWFGLMLWQWLDPEADPGELAGRVRDWLDERLERSESFQRTFEDIRHLTESEEA